MKHKSSQQTISEKQRQGWVGAQYVIIILAVVVILLMVISWIMPPAAPNLQATGTISAGLTGTPAQPTALQTQIPEPTPENVGYANGIIILSAVLCLILLMVTLRELLYHRRQPSPTAPVENGENHA